MITRAIAVKIRKTITPTIKQEVKLSFANEFINKKNKIIGIRLADNLIILACKVIHYIHNAIIQCR